MLSCSLRLGPTVDGKQQIWHLEEKAGANVVVTCPPSFIDEVINFPDAEDIKFEANRIEVDPPKESWTSSCASRTSSAPTTRTATPAPSTTRIRRS
jgi:hypothetical protein